MLRRLIKLLKGNVLLLILCAVHFSMMLTVALLFRSLDDSILKTEKCGKLTSESAASFEYLTSPSIMVSENGRLNLGLKDLVIVTFASFDHISEAM